MVKKFFRLQPPVPEKEAPGGCAQKDDDLERKVGDRLPRRILSTDVDDRKNKEKPDEVDWIIFEACRNQVFIKDFNDSEGN